MCTPVNVYFFSSLRSGFGYDTYNFSDVLLNGKQVHELSTICHASKVRDRAKAVVFKLKNELPRQQFAIAIQVPPSPLSSHNIKIKMQNHHRQDYDQTQTTLKLLQRLIYCFLVCR